MSRWTLAVILCASILVPLAVNAQQASPDPRAMMQKIFVEAKTNAFAALSPDHRTRVGTIVQQLNTGAVDRRAAAEQIDALLSPNEKTAILAVEQKAFGELRAARSAANPNAAVPAPGGPPPGAPPGGVRRAPDPGRFLVLLSRPQRRGLPPEQRSPNAQ